MTKPFENARIDETLPNKPSYYDLPRHEQIAVQRDVMRRGICEGIPARYATASLDTWTTPTAKHAAVLAGIRDYAAKVNASPNYRLGLVLHGIAGCGKTELATGIMREITRPGRNGVFASMTGLARELQIEYDGAESSGDIIGDLRDYPIAVIDDLGAERPTADVAAKIADILHWRYNETLITILTSNLLWPSGFVARYGERATGRLGQCCRARALPDHDFREVISVCDEGDE